MTNGIPEWRGIGKEGAWPRARPRPGHAKVFSAGRVGRAGDRASLGAALGAESRFLRPLAVVCPLQLGDPPAAESRSRSPGVFLELRWEEGGITEAPSPHSAVGQPHPPPQQTALAGGQAVPSAFRSHATILSAFIQVLFITSPRERPHLLSAPSSQRPYDPASRPQICCSPLVSQLTGAPPRSQEEGWPQISFILSCHSSDNLKE